MCQIDNNLIEFAQEDMTVYKVVTRGRIGENDVLFSPLLPNERVCQSGYDTTGTTLHFYFGSESESPMPGTPGIYVYLQLDLAMDYAKHLYVPMVVLKCLVPKGTKFVRGLFQLTARVEKLTPVRG